jgi:membrane associated rhomboid family serine protease
MVLSPVSLIAIAAMVGALAVGWSRRFLAAGALAISNVIVFALTAFGPVTRFRGETMPTIHAELGLWSPNLAGDPALGALQLFTSMFVHAGIFHLIGNLVILLAFAMPFEERIGHRRFLLIYVASGLVGALVQVGVSASSPILLMGASGAVFGIIGAFAASYPNLIVPLPLPLFVVMFFVRMRVWVAALVFAALQVVLVAVSSANPYDSTAYFAHLGGLVAGIFLGWSVVKTSVPAAHRPVAVDLGALSPFARDPGTTQALAQMKTNHDEPQIFQAWLDRFFRTATCPTCGHKVMPRHHGEIVCTQGHRFDVRQDKHRPIAA